MKLPDYVTEQIDKRNLSKDRRIALAKSFVQNPHAWWIPTGAQEEFINELSQINGEVITLPNGKKGRCRNAGFFGGKCTGKTSMLTNCIIALSEPADRQTNHWFKRSAFFTKRNWAHQRGLNGSLNMLLLMKKTVVNLVFEPEMKIWAAKDSYETLRGDGYTAEWQFKSGAHLHVFTPEQSVEQIAGPTFDVIFTDETFRMNAYQELQDRLRGRAPFISFMTPLWNRDANDLIDKLKDMPEPLRVFMTAHKYSACKKRGVRGFRLPEDIDEEVRSCDPEFYPAVVEGNPMAYSGKMFKTFSEANILDDAQVAEFLSDGKFTLYAACDPAEARPYAFIWGAARWNGDLLILDEWPEFDPGISQEPVLGNNILQYYLSPRLVPFHEIKGLRLNPREAADIVMAKEAILKQTYGKDVYVRFIDPRYSSRALGQGQVQLRAQLAYSGVIFEPAIAELECSSGHSKIRQMLQMVQDESGKIVKLPQLYFSHRVRNTIQCVSKIAYDGEQKRGAYTGRLSEEIDKRDKLKDFIDCLRYLVQRNPHYVADRKAAKEENPDVIVNCFGQRVRSRNFGKFRGM